MKACPFRVRVALTDKYHRAIFHENDYIAFHETEFLPCLEKQCMAYNDGKCMMIEKKRFEEEYECSSSKTIC